MFLECSVRSFQSLRKSIKFEGLSGWEGWFTPARLSFTSTLEFSHNLYLSGSCTAGSNNNGKNCPSIFSPEGMGGTPASSSSFEAEQTPSRKTLITAPRRGRELRFS